MKFKYEVTLEITPKSWQDNMYTKFDEENIKDFIMETCGPTYELINVCTDINPSVEVVR